MNDRLDISEEIALLEIEVQAMFAKAKSPHASIRAMAVADRNAPHALMVLLSKDVSYEVRRGLLANPSCPGFIVGALVDLIMSEHDHPNKLGCDDPDSSLMLLAAAHHNIPDESLVSIISDYGLEDSSFRSDLVEKVLSNPSATSRALYWLVWCADMDNAIFERACLHKNFQQQLFDAAMLEQLELEGEESWVAEELVKEPLATPDVLRKIFADLMKSRYSSNIRDLINLAKNPATPPDLIFKLSNLVADKWLFSEACEEIVPVARSSKRHPVKLDFSCENGILLAEELAASDMSGLRFFIAKNPSTPGSVLAQLACDVEPLVRSEVAQNPSCPSRILQQLATDPDGKVRMKVARNPNCPICAIEGFINSPFHEYREALASSAAIPKELLKFLALDQDGQVAKAARSEMKRRDGLQERA